MSYPRLTDRALHDTLLDRAAAAIWRGLVILWQPSSAAAATVWLRWSTGALCGTRDIWKFSSFTRQTLNIGLMHTWLCLQSQLYNYACWRGLQSYMA